MEHLVLEIFENATTFEEIIREGKNHKGERGNCEETSNSHQMDTRMGEYRHLSHLHMCILPVAQIILSRNIQ